MNRAKQSEATYDEAAMLAAHNGMDMTNPSDGCYQLRHRARGWIINLYPRRKGFTPRCYHDPNHRGPYLKMREDWSLVDAVEAAIAAEAESSPVPRR